MARMVFQSRRISDRPHQRPDEHQVAAILRPQQFCKPAELPDRNPVMTKARHRNRIADASQREKHRADAARDQRVRDCERQHAAGRDQADRR
jgi:hypothetical protein